MTQYTLHKISEGFIITSDEIPIKDNIVINNLDNLIGKATRELNKGEVKDKEYSKVIAQQEQIDFLALSEEEQKTIRRFDIRKMCSDSYKKYEIPKETSAIDYLNGFQAGFQKAKELLSDRIFTLEDMNQAVFIGARNHTTPGKAARKLNNYIQSLSKKSWSIKIEMEWVADGVEEHCEGGTLCGVVTEYEQPKLTNNKIKILKLL